MGETEERRLKKRIQIEERKLLLAQRKLEATRILEKLFDRVAKMKEAELAKKLEAELADKKRKEEEKLEKKEKEIREKLLKQIGDRKRAKEAAELAKQESHNSSKTDLSAEKNK